jgi:hypothetical protein
LIKAKERSLVVLFSVAIVAGCALDPKSEPPVEDVADTATSDYRFQPQTDTGPDVPQLMDTAGAVDSEDLPESTGELPGDVTEAVDAPVDMAADVSPPEPCNPVGSKGCDTGAQCFPDPKGNQCLSPGSKPHGSPCSAWNDCAWGTLCVAGTCRQVCDASGQDKSWLCKPGVPCEKIVFEGAGTAGKNLGACKPGDDCDALTDAGCKFTQTCVPSGALKTCQDAGKGKPGEPCQSIKDCQVCALCLDAGGSGVCRQKCATDGGEPVCAGKCSPILGPDGKAVSGGVGFCVQ